MKKTTSIIITILLILVMSFPVSAAAPMTDYRQDFIPMIDNYERILNIIRTNAKASSLPFSLNNWICLYRETGYTYEFYFFDSPVVQSGTKCIHAITRADSTPSIYWTTIMIYDEMTYNGQTSGDKIDIFAHTPTNPNKGKSSFAYILPEFSTATFAEANSVGSILADKGLAIYAVTSINKDVLRDILQQANNIQNNNYTDESWNNFVTSRSAGQSVYDNNSATQSQVDTAANDLSNAMSGLRAKPPPSSSSSLPPSSSSSRPPNSEPVPSDWYNPPENFLDIENGFQLKHLLPATVAIWDNIEMGRFVGLGIFAVVVGLYVMVRVAKRLFGIDHIDRHGME